VSSHIFTLLRIQNNHINDDATVELVDGALKAVKVAVDDLVSISDRYVQRVGNPDQQRLISNYTKQLAGGQTHLESSARTLSPAIVDDNCRQHVVDTADFVRNVSEGVCRASLDNLPNDPELSSAFFNAASNVYFAVDTLLEALNVGEDKSAAGGDIMRNYELLLASIPVLQSKTSNQKQLLDGVKVVAMNGNEILRAAVEIGVHQPPESKKEINRLVALNKQNLAQFTPKGKDAVRQPSDMQAREALSGSSEEVKQSMDSLMQVAKVANVDSQLRAAAKRALGKQMALSAAIHEASKDLPAYQKIIEESKPLQTALTELLNALHEAANHPQEKPYQDKMLNQSKLSVPLMGKQIANVCPYKDKALTSTSVPERPPKVWTCRPPRSCWEPGRKPKRQYKT
jgi:hypothetical protein